MIRAVVALGALACSLSARGLVLTVAERGGSGFAIGVPAQPTPAQPVYSAPAAAPAAAAPAAPTTTVEDIPADDLPF